MKKIVSLLLALLMLVSTMLALSSCGAPQDDGAEIKIYVGSEIDDLDPTDYYVNSNAEQMMSLIFEPLFRVNANGALELAQAQSYTVDETAREIVINLRETYWSDNSRVKADDFIYAWSEKILNPNNPNPAAALLYDIENAAAIKGGVSGFTTSDLGARSSGTYQITIKYREGADYMQILRNLSSVATSPIRRSVVDASPTSWSKSSITCVSNGAFKLSRLNALTKELVISRNKGYHQNPDVVDYDNLVTPGQVVGFFTPYGETVEVSYADIEAKTVFYMFDAPADDQIANGSKAVKKDDTSVYTYVFNTEKALFANAKVRAALSLVIDRAAIVAAIGEGIAADGFVPTISGGSSEALISAGADKAAAEALLAEVDLTGLSKSFTITVEDNEKSKIVAELVEEAWESLGFKVTVKTVGSITTELPAESKDAEPVEITDSAIQVLAKEASYGKRDFDVLALDWQTFTSDPFVALASLTSNMNGNGKDFSTGLARTSISGWFDAHYDSLVTEAFQSTGEDRAAKLALAEAYLVSESPIVPLYFNQTVAYASAELSGITYDLFGTACFTRTQQRNYHNYLERED